MASVGASLLGIEGSSTFEFDLCFVPLVFVFQILVPLLWALSFGYLYRTFMYITFDIYLDLLVISI